MFEWSSTRIVNINIYFGPLSLLLHWQTSTRKWNRKVLWCPFDLNPRTVWMFLKTIHLYPTIFLAFSFIAGLIFVTARKRSFGQGNIFGRHVSFILFTSLWCHSLSGCMVPWKGVLCAWSHVPSAGSPSIGGVSVQGVSVHGGLCRRGVCPRGLCLPALCPVMSRWYASYWNTFLWISLYSCKQQRTVNLVSCPNKTNSR